ncbi:E3 ubiquitin-protein ligase At1g63170 isoform X2 [Tripterygium wilfordii]|uniref:E3 ubiquitin-protein ligase At1g63170 isoform X2 n=1 Tax=Tripterygium wilfordii TaxID=458696 RepID=UPI0018F83D8A|nr:E3 ubiquitin-protein ligase At1g63170 isoform X2 [Tripterygium wilfordii]
MDVSSLEIHSESQTDSYPLLMDRAENLDNSEHVVIDIQRTTDSSLLTTSPDRTSNVLDTSQHEDRPSSSARTPIHQPLTPSSNSSNSRNPSFIGRRETRRRMSPLNSGLWISVELALTVSQIVAAVVVLSLSRHEHPRAPLFEWIIGYASGCVATLPLLYWRYRHRNLVSGQDSAQPRQSSPHINVPAGPFSLSVTRTSEGEDHRSAVVPPRGDHDYGALNARLKVLVEYFKMALDCFFAVWFVVGNVWIFGGHSSASEAPNLYRICLLFLTISCIGEDLGQTRGATPESIDALPTYKFKVKKNRHTDDRGGSSSASDGGVVAAGTDKERIISGEDAVCCICLAKYANNDQLRELPCSHFFHKECVDKWLKINALCPLCKNEVGESVLGSHGSSSSSSHRRVENRVGNGLAGTMF